METTTRELSKDQWGPYFNAFSHKLRNTNVSVLVEGLDLGVQPEAVKLPLQGITYDHQDNAVEIATEALRHRIPAPQSIFVQEDTAGQLLSFAIRDGERHEQIIEFDRPVVVGVPG